MPVPIDVTEAGIVTAVRFLQRTNALFPMEVMPEWSSTFSREEQAINAESGIAVIAAESFTLFADEQNIYANEPISITESGMMISVIEEHLEKALSPI